jgi:glycerophosphoryl diester phosphodiesterase
LEETLDFLDKKVMVFVELKEMGLEEKVLALIKKKRLNKNVIVVSFLEDALKKVRLLDAEIQTGLIYAKHKNPLKAALDLKNGLKVLAWTVNTPEEVAELVKKGVDAIASDKPDILAAVEADKKNDPKT